MQDIKTFPKMLKRNILCNIIRKKVKLIYSGNGCPEGQLDIDSTIIGAVVRVNDDTFCFEFKNVKDPVELTIEDVDGFELL